ncbi:DUF4124 domain-containing protein [Paracidovorax avenae]|uniref:DUF4124 domain-containing protein n=1 Tax=Paracidovorax avenae TaxID=80867 RepID=UPI000D21F68C|nr:DUF4124 domain-containing protein [Paracidovorax avenae]AVS68125.1 DUF4124 domain-containing protein [Paracidovorax avenae]
MRHGLILCALLLAATGATAQVHKCRDSTGKLVFSDRPCEAGQSGELVQRQRTKEEILRERLEAAEANERKYRARSEAKEDELSQQRRALNQPVQAASPATAPQSQTRACQDARKELDFVSSIRTLSQSERRMRTNAAITNVNAACGSNTPLMQEPTKVEIHTPPSVQPTGPRNCMNMGGGMLECH